MAVAHLQLAHDEKERRPAASFRTVELAGWGNHPRASCLVADPAFPDQLPTYLEEEGVLARGMGRSYGDACFNDQGVVVDCTGLSRMLAFDDDTGVLTVEAGATLGQIIDTLGPRGWFPTITPGTKLVTVGGCIANDVHGKAHHADGCFSKCVDSFTILLADGRVVSASREESSDLFWACFGGLGLLGIILTATIRLRKIETTYFAQRAIVAGDLDEMMDAIDETNDTYPYAVAWVDALASGDQLGKGVLTVGDHATVDELPENLRRKPLALSAPAKIAVPFDLPSATLNLATVRALNLVIKQVQARGAPFAHYEQFFYPLDAIGSWNRGYGKRGFTQYQFVVPLDDGRRTVRTLLEEIASSGYLPFLNVLKRLGPEEGLISFPFEGYTFAVDFPIADGLDELLHRLDGMVVEFGGRIYLGKDAFVRPETFRAMYPKLDEWLAIKAKYDPGGKFTSNLGRRVGLCSGAQSR